MVETELSEAFDTTLTAAINTRERVLTDGRLWRHSIQLISEYKSCEVVFN